MTRSFSYVHILSSYLCLLFAAIVRSSLGFVTDFREYGQVKWNLNIGQTPISVKRILLVHQSALVSAKCELWSSEFFRVRISEYVCILRLAFLLHAFNSSCYTRFQMSKFLLRRFTVNLELIHEAPCRHAAFTFTLYFLVSVYHLMPLSTRTSDCRG